ncbi:Adenine deaminase [Salinivirga cyanobacteriivorans]|uniref:Adenine deaminase n=1 Tax=Salinivirga cyanobacteriivorans TaxID=1307839 RepID=A0A0S2I082_9BACT|nr:adenine deaminase [Salinivirga cyanobacteriivorans]ALO15694.1 Adenine deaminase [Salinivirga cyanobacteriivorans]
MKVRGNFLDFRGSKFFIGELAVQNGKIGSIKRFGEGTDPALPFILPGLIDAHVHIESTMVTPKYFAGHVVKFGTVGVVTDPHEISNVCGVEGFEYMYNEARNTPLGVYFGVPSCVPATPFESSGATFDADTINYIFENYDTVALSEMMNFPGVVNGVPDVMEKLQVARNHEKVIDGHAPALKGTDLKKYIGSGISTDHEAFTYDEAKEKIKSGMMIQIREGSAARNFEALHELISEYPEKVMFCTDDAHPDTLINGHIDRIVKMALDKGHSIFDILKAASFNAVKHYDLPVGSLRINDSADFIIVNNLTDFTVQKTILKGEDVYDLGKNLEIPISQNVVNRFEVDPINAEQLKLPDKNVPVKIIEALDGELITKSFTAKLPVIDNFLQTDTSQDILKIAVVNRYDQIPKVQVGFVKGFNLKNGAFASSIAHDSHNVICVGVNDHDMLMAINTLIAEQGGIGVCADQKMDLIPLPVGGLMANESIENMAVKYNELDQKVKELGSGFHAPFMTLAFMSLLVIPSLKIGDRGLFNVDKFDFVDLYEA